MGWREWRLFTWMDRFEERFVPAKWRGSAFSDRQQRVFRAALALGGGVWLLDGVLDLVRGAWLSGLFQVAGGAAFILGRRRYVAWVVRKGQQYRGGQGTDP